MIMIGHSSRNTKETICEEANQVLPELIYVAACNFRFLQRYQSSVTNSNLCSPKVYNVKMVHNNTTSLIYVRIVYSCSIQNIITDDNIEETVQNRTAGAMFNM